MNGEKIISSDNPMCFKCNENRKFYRMDINDVKFIWRCVACNELYYRNTDAYIQSGRIPLQ